MNPAFSDIVGRLKAAGRITAEDVLAMRAQVYAAPQVAREDVEALIALDASAHDFAPEWGGFVADAMVDFVVHQQDPEDYVDDAKAAWLVSACAGPLTKGGGVEALVRVLETASNAPESLEAFVLGKVKAAVVAAGRLAAEDVALLRRLIFAGASEGNIGVTREEADALFDVDAACGANADPSWPTFFAQAIDDALTAVSPFHVESREDAQKDAAWLASRPGLFDFFKQMVAKPDVGGAMEDILHPYKGEQWQAADDRIEADEAAAAPITDEEADWLVQRLGAAPLSAAGHALVERLKAQVPDAGGRLKPLIDAA
ncbi:MAG TPA: hypothetical protein VG248_11955 [Caulobacteraceae bacterium]|jgi:hypothetical protein|nr:hypothetical protein [Caulobacteraceae bacterium]